MKQYNYIVLSIIGHRNINNKTLYKAAYKH